MNPIIIIIPIIYIIFKFVMSKNGLKSADVQEIINNGGKIIDVRSAMEYKGNHVKNAKNIEHDKILKGIKKAKISKETPLLLYCASGMRSSAACSQLKGAGYTNVHNAGTVQKLKKLLSV